jgi:signal transduction histidine kinase
MSRSPLTPVVSRDDGSAGPYAGCMERVSTWPRRHPLLVDGALAAGLLALAVFSSGSLRSLGAGELTGDIAITVLVTGPVLVRRQHPVAAFAVALAGILAALSTDLRVSEGGWALPAVLVLLYSLAACRPRRVSLCGLFMCEAVVVIGLTSSQQAVVSTKTAWVALELTVPIACSWIFGDSVAYRRAHNAWLEERARRAEAERDAKAQLAAAAERSRIAREMHDIVAHNLSVIVGLADGGRYAAVRSPERSTQALGAIASTGREALSELRRLLGVLTGDDGRAADLAPQPGIADLEALLDRVRAAGLPVIAVMQRDPAGLSEGQQLTVYRIVQEALTNTLKHAGPAATAEVVLDYADGAVDVQVTDTGRGTTAGAPDGRGLHGMRERAAMYEGTLRAGPGPSGGWRVEAHLPGPEATAAAS